MEVQVRATAGQKLDARDEKIKQLEADVRTTLLSHIAMYRMY